MSRNIIIIVVVLVLAGLGWWYWQGGFTPSPTMYESGDTMPADGSLPTPQSDTSSAALEKDTAAIDAQLNAAVSGAAAVDQSLNDTPVVQEQL